MKSLFNTSCQDTAAGADYLKGGLDCAPRYSRSSNSPLPRGAKTTSTDLVTPMAFTGLISTASDSKFSRLGCEVSSLWEMGVLTELWEVFTSFRLPDGFRSDCPGWNWVVVAGVGSSRRARRAGSEATVTPRFSCNLPPPSVVSFSLVKVGCLAVVQWGGLQGPEFDRNQVP